jgi:predicted transcriptional regulator
MSALSQPQTERLTIEIEHELAQRFRDAANERGISLSELMVGFTEWELTQQDSMTAEPFTPEQVAQIEESLAQIERGETVSNEEVFAQLKQRYPDQTGRQIIEAAIESYAELSSYAVDMVMVEDDAEALMAAGIADMEGGNETDQEEVFAHWQTRYG